MSAPSHAPKSSSNGGGTGFMSTMMKFLLAGVAGAVVGILGR